MNTRFKNEKKMRKYLGERAKEICMTLTEEDYHDNMQYAIDFLEQIVDDEEFTHAREGASLAFDISGEEVEVWVTYDKVVEHDEIVYIIDFDYSREDFLSKFAEDLSNKHGQNFKNQVFKKIKKI